MWHWEVQWRNSDGEAFYIRSGHGWKTLQEAKDALDSIKEFVFAKLSDMGAVGVIDVQIVYHPRR